MWIVPKNLVASACILILMMRIFRRMFGFGNQFKIRQVIMCPVIIFVMYIIYFRDFAVCGFPHITMQIMTVASSATIISIWSACVFLVLINNKRQRFNGAHFEFSSGKSFISRLPTNSKCFSDLRQTESLLIQVVHCFRNLDVWFATHNYNLQERLANVN